MLKNLNWQTKNHLLTAGTVVLLLLCWPLAFRKTIDALSLNRKLSLLDEDKGKLSFNPEYLEQKHRVLSKLVASYTIDSAQWKNEFWLNVSRSAAGKGIAVSYTPEQAKEQDKDKDSKVIRQSILFGADYRHLVTLLDTLEKMKGVGFITSAKFDKVKGIHTEGNDKLILKTVFSVLGKE